MSEIGVAPQAHDISVTDSAKIGYSRARHRAAETDFCQKVNCRVHSKSAAPAAKEWSLCNRASVFTVCAVFVAVHRLCTGSRKCPSLAGSSKKSF